MMKKRLEEWFNGRTTEYRSGGIGSNPVSFTAIGCVIYPTGS